jgi:hypothetical protein
MSPFILRWPQVDIENIRFEQSNVVDAHFLDSARFQVLQGNGEPEGYSNFFEETDAFSVVSSQSTIEKECTTSSFLTTQT